MGFWDWVDKIAGYIPVVGTIKDGVEAVVLECEGKHEAAKEKALETVVDLAGDIVTVATLGEGYEVAVAGKAAAEAAMKDAVESGLKSVAKTGMEQATKDGFTKKAATVFGIAAAAQEAKILAKEEIAKRAGKKAPERPKPDSKPDEPKKKEDPKRGHHVINNGVRQIFPNLIDKFLVNNAHYFDGQSFEQLVAQGHINPQMIVYASHERPFNEADDTFIQTTVAFTPEGRIHQDENDVEYGTLIFALMVSVSTYMTAQFLVLVKNRPMSRPEQISSGAIMGLVDEINTTEVYVDKKALEWWVATGGNLLRCEEVRGVVSFNFQALLSTGGPNFVLTWVQDLFRAYELLHE